MPGRAGVFSGRRSRGVTAARYTAGAVVLVLLLLFQVWGLLIGVPLLLVVFASTTDTGTGSTVASWVQDHRRWRYRVRSGFTDFVPVDDRPDDLTPTVEGSRAERRAALREWNTYRDWPDGVDGLYWLESRPGLPAVAYHAGTGDTPYLSAAFAVDGPIQGLHGDAFVAQAQAGVRAVDGRLGRRPETGHRHPGGDPGDPRGLGVARGVAAGPARPRRPAGPANRLHHPARGAVRVLVRATPLPGGAVGRGRAVPVPRPPAGPRPGRLAVAGQRRNPHRPAAADRCDVPGGAGPVRAATGRGAAAPAAPRLAHRPRLRRHRPELLAALPRRTQPTRP